MFDVITSSFCFECASSDKEMYIRSVGNVSRLLKPGGYLIIMGCIGASYYKVDKYIFPVCPLTTEEIRLIYERNGFEVLNMETLYTDGNDPDIADDNTLEDNKNVFTLLARKVVS
ncbi:hypothetical protein FSP39_016593 [Pinctada imbricata]|uniref:Uncharacterized protein n=1 Tax=Pinctada imbricata TaxID=66713 RepID=A0AA88XZC4_PINIB|nr:hypothetical protein FSP39_016593 [Pinctada imbricata]